MEIAGRNEFQVPYPIAVKKNHPLMIVSARFQKENTWREVSLLEHFLSLNIPARFCLCSTSVSSYGYPLEYKEIALARGYTWIDSAKEFLRLAAGSTAVICGSWKDYFPLLLKVRLRGRPVIVFNSTSGLDNWSYAANFSVAKSDFCVRQEFHLLRPYARSVFPTDHISSCGSFAHARADRLVTVRNRDEFCRHFGLGPEAKIAVLFPKSIGGYEKKIAVWFPHWRREEVRDYAERFIQSYRELIAAGERAGMAVFVKMHPMAYASIKCEESEELRFWKSLVPPERIIASEHTYDFFTHMDVGLGIQTHASIDCAYFRKPFVYYRSAEFEPPANKAFHLNGLTALPLGPSAEWRTKPREIQWIPNWTGFYAESETVDAILERTLREPLPEADYDAIIQEYWGASLAPDFAPRCGDVILRALGPLLARGRISIAAEMAWNLFIYQLRLRFRSKG